VQSFQKIISQQKHSEEKEIKIKKIFNSSNITYPNIFGINSQYKKFIILSTQRSGTSYLSNLLQSHSKIVCYSELFHPERCSFDYPLFPEDTDEKVLQFRNSKPKKFLKEMIFRGYEENFKSVGFKIHYPQLEDKRFKPATSWLKKDRKVMVIHLIRKNFLNTLVSHKLALGSKIWWQADPLITQKAKQIGIIDAERKETDISTYDSQQLFIPFEEALLYFEHLEQQIIWWRKTFEKHPVLEITYEELIIPDSPNISEIQQFLGVDPMPLFSRIIKQKKRTNHEIITNYNILKEKCQGTRWASFFE
jgi:LPS sulfotransferase NodH